MKPANFALLAEILERRSGLELSRESIYLLESRLTPVAQRHGFEDLDALALSVRRHGGERLLEDVTEAMTTNKSQFFRDIRPFQMLRRTLLPELMAARPERSLRIWSAACSSGEEPYSISMLLKEEGARLDGWRVDVMATDLSQQMLAKAGTGLYTQLEVQRGLPVRLMVKYFHQTGDRWRIDASIRAMVEFRRFNLMDDLAPLGAFDVVFCRNVLMYFGRDNKRKVLEGIARLMPADGFLCLGATENLLGITDRFQPIHAQRGLYRLAKAADRHGFPPRPAGCSMAPEHYRQTG